MDFQKQLPEKDILLHRIKSHNTNKYNIRVVQYTEQNMMTSVFDFSRNFNEMIEWIYILYGDYQLAFPSQNHNWFCKF